MEMISVKIAELTGPALDWAVATTTKAWETAHELFPTWTLDATFRRVDAINGHCILVPNNPMRQDPQVYSPSTEWSQGGPLIEKMMKSRQWEIVHIQNPDSIAFQNYDSSCFPVGDDDWNRKNIFATGSTVLEAGCRALVESVTENETIEVPSDLLGESK